MNGAMQWALVLASQRPEYRAARRMFMAHVLRLAIAAERGSIARGCERVGCHRAAARYMLTVADEQQLTGPQREAIKGMAAAVFTSVSDYHECGRQFERLLANAALRTVPGRKVRSHDLPNHTRAARLIHVHRNYFAQMLRKGRK